MKYGFKKYKVMIWLLVLLQGMLYTPARAQDISAELKEVNKKLLEHRYQFQVTYRLFDSYTTRVSSETQVMDIKMWDLMISIKNKEFEVVKNKDHYVYLNHSQKVIMFNSVKQYGADLKQLKQMEQMIDLDTLIKSYRKIELLRTDNSTKTWRLHMRPAAREAYVDITINTNAHRLEGMVMYFRKTLNELYGIPDKEDKTGLPRMELTFSNYVFPQKPDLQLFSITPYIVKTGKQYKPVPAYKAYKFIDNTY